MVGTKLRDDPRLGSFYLEIRRHWCGIQKDKSSTFGAEFVALRIAAEIICSFRYNMRMFGIPLDGPANGFCDNKAIYRNAAFVKSKLKKNLIRFIFIWFAKLLQQGKWWFSR